MVVVVVVIVLFSISEQYVFFLCIVVNMQRFSE